MNIVQAFRNLFQYWDAINHCGECWEFEAPMTERIANTSLPKSESGECCYRVFLIGYGIRENRSYNASGLIADRYDEHTFELLVLKESDPGRNMDMEQIHTVPQSEAIQYTADESKWELYHFPVLECFRDSFLEELCRLMGRSFRNPTRTWSPEINYADQNYDGWRIRFGIQDYKPEDDTLYEYVIVTISFTDDSDETAATFPLTITITGEESLKQTQVVLTDEDDTAVFLNTGLDTTFAVHVENPENSDEEYVLYDNTPTLEKQGEQEYLNIIVTDITVPEEPSEEWATHPEFTLNCWNSAPIGDDTVNFTIASYGGLYKVRSGVCTDPSDPLGSEVTFHDEASGVTLASGTFDAFLSIPTAILGPGEFHYIAAFADPDNTMLTAVNIDDLPAC